MRRPPPQPELIYVDEKGQVCFRWDAPGADENAFFDWQNDACSHGPMGELVSHRLGNLAGIGSIRSLLAKSSQDFPVLLTKVVYDGTHAGDWLTLGDVERLGPELDRLSAIHASDEPEEALVREFEREMLELAAAATQTRKPIVF